MVEEIDLGAMADELLDELEFAGINPVAVRVYERNDKNAVWVQALEHGIDFRLESALIGISDNEGYEMEVVEDGLFSVSA